MTKRNNQYLKGIAENTGSQVTGHRSDNYYLKKIEQNTKNGGGGGSGFSGDYNDLINKPTIPSDVSDLTDNRNTAFTPKSHNHLVSDITDFPTLQFVVITDNKGTASEDTMGKLYIVSENNKVNAYYSINKNNSYSWKQLDEDMLDNISIPTDVSDLTDTQNTQFTPKSHTHTESQISDLGDYIEKSNTVGLVKNDGTIDTSTYLTEHQDISGKVDKETGKGLFSGSYTDLTNKPSIPSSSSDLSDSSTLVKKSQTSGLLKNDGTVDTTQYLSQHQSLSNYIEKSQTVGLVMNDGEIDETSYLDEGTVDVLYVEITYEDESTEIVPFYIIP